MLVTPLSTFTAILEGAPTGLTGTVGVRVLSAADDSVSIARTTSGIAEAIAGSGTYEIQLTSPSTPGEYVIVWDDGGTSPADFASEPLTVGGVAPPPVVTSLVASAGLQLAQSNAVLTAVSSASGTEDWDRIISSANVWTGVADAYISVIKSRTSAGDQSSVITDRSVLLPREIPVTVGSALTVVTDEGVTESVTVRTIDRRVPPPGVRGPVRITGEAA